ncbi:MAG: potassium-transporting ATPase subunit KdpC [Acetobacteraceae bacterium]
MNHIRPAIVMMLAMTLLTGLAYPLAVTAIAQLVFPWQANGSLLRRNATVIGAARIGQNFTSDRYFHPRPSATTGPDPADPARTIGVPYNGANSAGSNLGPTSRELVRHVQARAAALAAQNPAVPVPVDLVTSSASGLDPDITPAGALFQVPRVARARGLPVAVVRRLVLAHITPRLFGVIGEPHVNVLRLNLALDALAGTGHGAR